MPTEVTTELRQFACKGCRGKDPSRHLYHVWHERVPCNNPVSQCRTCKKMVEAVPQREVEGVKICHFTCEKCDNEYRVCCKMQNTTPCYECGTKEVSPHAFEKLRSINKKTDKTHNCSECDGYPNCPNKQYQQASSSSDFRDSGSTSE